MVYRATVANTATSVTITSVCVIGKGELLGRVSCELCAVR